MHVSCPERNLYKIVPEERSIRGAQESLFSAATRKTPKPVTAPKEDKILRTGTKNARRCGEMATWGCSIICKKLVSFDFAPFGPSSTLSSDRRELMAEGRTVSLSNGRSRTSGEMVTKLKRDPRAPY
jgi:hypothetical protein